MKKEKTLEINLKGNPDHNEYMEEISQNSYDKLVNVLASIVAKGKYNNRDIKRIVSLSKWINEL